MTDKENTFLPESHVLRYPTRVFSAASPAGHFWPFDSEPKNIYIAASMDNQQAALRLAFLLGRASLNVTSSWLSVDAATSNCNYDVSPQDVADMQRSAGLRDIEDLEKADTLVVLNDIESTTGGLHFEVGYFLGRGRTNVLIVNGRRDNVFFHLSPVRWLDEVTNFGEVVDKLTATRKVAP